MSRRNLVAAIAATVFLALAAGPLRAETVDLQLVLAADVSRSVDEAEFKLQREGYAAALVDPRVLRAIRSGRLGKIAVCYFEWSGEQSQKVIVDWTIVSDEESAGQVADLLMTAPRAFANRTSIGVAIEYAMGMLRLSPHESPRRTIDVSGDGTNTNGIFPTFARDRAVEAGVTINGLVILSPVPMPWNPYHTHPPGGLENYFRENVIGGQGAFTMVVEDFNSFSYAIVNKLIREIADTGAADGLAQHQPDRARDPAASAPRMVGEAAILSRP